MPSLLACPKCGEYDYHNSHTRNIIERIRKIVLHQRPYRCHSCNYRGWIIVKVVGTKVSSKSVFFYVSILIISIIIGLIIGSTIN